MGDRAARAPRAGSAHLRPGDDRKHVPQLIRPSGPHRTQGVTEPYSLFSKLDTTGRFRRDTFLGRIFHPGTVSYREIAAKDSLHITVSRDNRLEVHVDSLSPLALGRDRPSQYSLGRAVGHNLLHSLEAVLRLCLHRRGAHRCRLECEVGTTSAAAPPGGHTSPAAGRPVPEAAHGAPERPPTRSSRTKSPITPGRSTASGR